MSTGFQYIFDNASVIDYERQPIVAQTQSRDGTIRATSRGGSVWRFKVTYAAGKPWNELRPILDSIDLKGRHTSDTVSFNSTGQSWIFPYRGASADITGWTVNNISGNTCTLAGTGSHSPVASEKLFAAGDLIQLGTNGHIYTVTADVTKTLGVDPTLTLHRPILESNATYTLTIGPTVSFKLFCTKQPGVRIFDHNLATFDGSFEFVEDMT